MDVVVVQLLYRPIAMSMCQVQRGVCGGWQILRPVNRTEFSWRYSARDRWTDRPGKTERLMSRRGGMGGRLENRASECDGEFPASVDAKV